jgi:hypothetical protein
MRVRKRKRYQFFIVLLLLGILLILFAAVLFLRLRGSVALKPSKLELSAQSITAYRQDEEGDYICMDPLADSLTKLSDYLGRVYAVRVVSCRP